MTAPKLQYHRVAQRAEIKPGEALRVIAEGREIALFNLEGEIYATDDSCTHAFASLSDGFVEGGTVECPLHAGRFDIRSGRTVSAPAREDLQTYAVKVEGEDVFVGVPARS